MNKITPVSLGYPVSVFNKNSTLKATHAHLKFHGKWARQFGGRRARLFECRARQFKGRVRQVDANLMVGEQKVGGVERGGALGHL